MVSDADLDLEFTHHPVELPTCRDPYSIDEQRCAFVGCDIAIATRGLCTGHYQQFRKGRPLTPIRRPVAVRDLDGEAWATIRGEDPAYLASNLGRIQSNLRAGPRILRESETRGGYLTVGLRKGDRRITHTIHSLVLLAFVGPRPAGLVTRHLDGNQKNNALTNLAYGTPSENAQDALRHGNHFYASRTHCLHGHEYTEDNTRWSQRGRSCRACGREWQRKRYAKGNGAEVI